MLDKAKGKALSDREREVLLLAAEGLTDKQIASRLKISLASAQTYWQRIREKYGVSSRAAAVARALREEYLQSNAEAAHAQEWLKILTDNLREHALFFVDKEGVIGSWNPGVERVLGYTHDEFIGMDFAEIFTEQDRAANIPALEMKGALERGHARDERWHLKRGGERIFVAGELAALHNGDNNIRGFAKIMRDDTRRKLMEEELAKIHHS
jgi:PAS domain S-box-containing protein